VQVLFDGGAGSKSNSATGRGILGIEEAWECKRCRLGTQGVQRAPPTNPLGLVAHLRALGGHGSAWLEECVMAEMDGDGGDDERRQRRQRRPATAVAQKLMGEGLVLRMFMGAGLVLDAGRAWS